MTSVELERLYARLERSLFNVVYRWVWNDEEAQEIVQDAFVRLWKMRDRVDMKTVDSLVFRIAVNRAADRRRWRKLRTWLSLDKALFVSDTKILADEKLELEVDKSRIREAVEELPDKLRHVVLLTELSELSYKEVAEVLNIEVGTVGSRRNRGLAWLRHTLAEGDKKDERSVRRSSAAS